VPYDPRKPFDPSGIRLGTPAVTTRGMTTEDMPRIASWIDAGTEAAKREDTSALDAIATEIREFVSAFPTPGVTP
jgi:glycine hydroxymethyltransferase